MAIQFGKATSQDINDLVEIRLAFLSEDHGEMTDEQIQQLRASLPAYYAKHLNQDLFVYVARKERIVSCCFLLISEKPANPRLIHGRTGTLFNVYTHKAYRRQGLAKKLLAKMLADAQFMDLDEIELKATDQGYFLYRSLGFQDEQMKYHRMHMIMKGK